MQPDRNNQVPRSRKSASMRHVKLAVWVLAIVVAALTIWQNWGWIDTEILFIKITMPRVAFVSLLLLVGFVVGLTTPSVFRRHPGD